MPADDRPARTISKYEIGRVLGRGGMGSVFQAWDPDIERDVAIKTLALAADQGMDAERTLARFRKEVRAAGRLHHPGIASIFDCGETGSLAFIAMEFIDGPTLKARLSQQPKLALRDILQIMDDVLGALEFSHGRGVIHRDIKPANIMLTAEGRAKIVDFGIASVGGTGFARGPTVLGTPAYMAPEQITGAPVDARADIYAAGCVLFEMLSGRRPFDGAPAEIAHRAVREDAPSLLSVAPAVPPFLEDVVATALAKQPENRFVSAASFAEALRSGPTLETAPAEHAPPPAPVAPLDVDNLPLEATSFIGRGKEVAEIAGALQERRRLTLVGAGGVGKTRTALRVGREMLERFADGVWLVELAPLADGGLVAEAVCRVVSAPVSGTKPPVDVAVAFLRQKQMLLILDNCEHLQEAAAKLAASLLAQCPGVHILATSRAPLRIPGEVVYRLPSLPAPAPREGLSAASAMRFASVQLFVQRASDAAGGYRLTDEDAPEVARICRRLDGVAMALELAAARMTVLKPAQIAARLETAFRLLNAGASMALPRHQTLWATIDWSHSLLSAEEQTLLRRLSVFVDGFSLEGAAAVAGGDGIDVDDLVDVLGLLVDKSLVSSDMSGAAPRFRMLQATRDYAREKLNGSAETWRDRLAAEYLAAFFERAEAVWAVTATEAWLGEFAPEVENLRAAIDWAFGQSGKHHAVAVETGEPALGVALVARAGLLAEELSLQADMKRWTQGAMAHLTPSTPPVQAGWVKFWATKWQAVFGVGEVSATRREAMALFRQAGDVLGLSCALRTTAMAIARPGQMPPEVEPMLREAIDLLRPLPMSKDLATALAHMGSFHYFSGDLPTARRYYEESQAMRRQLGDRTGALASAMNLAELEFNSGHRATAIAFARQAVAEARRIGSVATLANLLANMAGYLLATDEVSAGRVAAREALALNRALDHLDWAVPCVEHLALAHALSGAYPQAARLLGYTGGHFKRTDQVRDLLEQKGFDRLAALLRERLPPETLDALMAEGAALADDVADAVALADAAAGGITNPAAAA